MKRAVKRIFGAGNRKTAWLTAALLLILVAATYAVLAFAFSRSGENADLTVNLFSGESRTVNMRAELEKEAGLLYADGLAYITPGTAMRPVLLGAEESITIEDSIQVWNTDTRVDIFRAEYKNGEAVTAVSGRGDHIIAPGTENSYTFSVKNNGSGTADYQLVFEAYASGLPAGAKLPVEARISGPGGYLPDGEEGWKGIESFNGTEDSQVLTQHGSSLYTLEWRWPYEGDDALDTLLGNLTAERPISLTVRISTAANYHNPEDTSPVIAAIPTLLNGKDHFAYIYGFPDGTVHPEADITRAEVAEIFFRLLKENVREENSGGEADYTDTAEDAWYSESVAALSRMGILKGYDDGSFRPGNKITRGEFAAVCARLSDSKLINSKTAFTDISGHWAEKSIRICEKNGWINGYGDGTFRPNSAITRAEAVTVINRMLHRVPEKRSDMYDEVYYWTDNADPEKWYYLAIQEASETHDYKRGTGTREFWREPAVKAEQPEKL